MRRLAWLLAAGALAACTGKDSGEPTEEADADADADTDADADADTDADADADSDADPAAEDCGDGKDNDSDGLTDCEDDECLDACVEDCGDGVDNDQDGAADCADDECFGQEGCGMPYSLSLTVDAEAIGVGWGFFPPILTAKVGVFAAAYGYVEVAGTPDGWDGDPFLCEGYFFAASSNPYGDPPYGIEYLGTGGGVDYQFTFGLNPADGSLEWDPGCPLDALPFSTWGFVKDQPYVLRMDDAGAWQQQYTAPPERFEADYIQKGSRHVTTNVLYAPTQVEPVTWEGLYAP